MRTILLVLAAVSMSGCMFQAFTPTQQLTDQVRDLVDEVRWARVDLATDRVAPEYRETFLESHREWGHDIRIADAEMTNVHLSDDIQTATARVEFSWYDQRTMELYTSVLSQHYTNSGDAFLLDGETIVAGDERLLDLPPEAEDGEADESNEAGDTDGPLASR